MRLYVNVDHVATVRQARRATEPDPVEVALACLRAGADGITVHLREDRRHAQDDDVVRLAAVPDLVLNLELATAPDILDLAARLKPHQVTFVPERRQEITTEGGLDLRPGGRPDPKLAAAVMLLADAGVRVSLFIDPDDTAVQASRDLGVRAVELHTGAYANAFPNGEAQLGRLQRAADLAADLGLAVHAGHGLTTANVGPVAAIPAIEELNIGHHLVSRSILVGIERAVRDMRTAMRDARVDLKTGRS